MWRLSFIKMLSIYMILAVFITSKVCGQGLKPCSPDAFPGNTGFCVTNDQLELCGALPGAVSHSKACRGIDNAWCCFIDHKPVWNNRRQVAVTSTSFQVNRNVRMKQQSGEFHPPKPKVGGQMRRTVVGNQKDVVNSALSGYSNGIYNNSAGSGTNPQTSTMTPTNGTSLSPSTNNPVTVVNGNSTATIDATGSSTVPSVISSSSITTTTPPATVTGSTTPNPNNFIDPRCPTKDQDFFLHVESPKGDVLCHDDSFVPTGIKITDKTFNCSQLYYMIKVIYSKCIPGPCFDFDDNNPSTTPDNDETNYIEIDQLGVVRGSPLTPQGNNTVLQCYFAVALVNNDENGSDHLSKNRVAFCLRIQGYNTDKNSTCPPLPSLACPAMAAAFADGEDSIYDPTCPDNFVGRGGIA